MKYIVRIGALLATLAALLLVLPLTVAAAEGDVLDPGAAREFLAATLTLAGATAAAALIAGFIQVLKTLPGLGTWLEAGHEYVASLVFSAALVGYAAWATGYAIDAVSGFGLFLAWLGLAKLIGGTYDTVSTAKASGIKAAITNG